MMNVQTVTTFSGTEEDTRAVVKSAVLDIFADLMRAGEVPTGQVSGYGLFAGIIEDAEAMRRRENELDTLVAEFVASLKPTVEEF